MVPVTDDVGITRNVGSFARRSCRSPIISLSGRSSATRRPSKRRSSKRWRIGPPASASQQHPALARLCPADLSDYATGSTFEIIPNSLTVARDGRAPSAADVTIAFNEAPICVPSSVTFLLRVMSKTVADYTGLITPWQSTKARFVATVSAGVAPYCDAQVVIASMPGQFDLDVAVGDQLDKTGEWIGQSRGCSDCAAEPVLLSGHRGSWRR